MQCKVLPRLLETRGANRVAWDHSFSPPGPFSSLLSRRQALVDEVRDSDASSFLLSSASGEGRFLYVQEMRDKEDGYPLCSLHVIPPWAESQILKTALCLCFHRPRSGSACSSYSRTIPWEFLQPSYTFERSLMKSPWVIWFVLPSLFLWVHNKNQHCWCPLNLATILFVRQVA